MTRLAVLVVAFLGATACAPAPLACPDGSTAEGCAPDASVPTCDEPPCIDAGEELPPPEDAGPGLPPPIDPPSTCDPDEVARWGIAHRSYGLTSALEECSVDPVCEGPPCTFSGCLRRELGIATCASCVTLEVDCLLGSCREACGVGAPLGACLACLCTSECTELFATCADMPLDVCDACHFTPRGCPAPLSPALIVAAIL